eukprot:4078560-Prymnesium_polylepis.2
MRGPANFGLSSHRRFRYTVTPRSMQDPARGVGCLQYAKYAKYPPSDSHAQTPPPWHPHVSRSRSAPGVALTASVSYVSTASAPPSEP